MAVAVLEVVATGAATVSATVSPFVKTQISSIHGFDGTATLCLHSISLLHSEVSTSTTAAWQLRSAINCSTSASSNSAVSRCQTNSYQRQHSVCVLRMLDHTAAITVAGAFTLAALVISCWQIKQHLLHNNNDTIRKLCIRIIGMVS